MALRFQFLQRGRDLARVWADSFAVGEFLERRDRDLEDFLAPEAARLVGAAGQPAFQNGWVNYGGSWAVASFWKDSHGVVHLEGLVTAGTLGAAVFALPVGYRPAKNHVFLTAASTASSVRTTCRFDVHDNGNVVPTDGGNQWVSMSGVMFRAA